MTDDALRLPDRFAETLDAAARVCHANSRRHGFWDDEVTPVLRKLVNAAERNGLTDVEKHELASVETFLRERERSLGANHGEKVALMHSELSEALEAMRLPEKLTPSAKIPAFSQVEEELADLFIRLGDYAAAFELNLGAAIVAKHEYNRGRPVKHGKTF